MKQGDLLYHQKRGLLTAKSKYSAIKNKLVWYGEDEQGKIKELDGTEMPFDKYVAEEEKKNAIKDKIVDKVLEEKTKEEDDKRREEQEKEQKMKEKQEKHKEILDRIEQSSEKIAESIKNIPETVIPEIPDHSKEYKEWKNEIIEALKIEIPEVDLKPVIEAIDRIKIPQVNIPKPIDYKPILDEIKKALPKDTDLSGVITAIENIPTFDIPERLIHNDRIKVEVDRISLGGSGGTSGKGLATEEKQDTIINHIAGIATEATLEKTRASVSNELIMKIYESGGYTYICYAQPGSTVSEAVWKIIRYDSDGSSLFADGDTNFNNVAEDYATLTY